MRILDRGFTLLEIIFTLFILSLLLAGLSASSLISTTANRSSYYFAVAANQIQNFREQIQMLSADDFQKKFLEWNDENKNLLPNGTGEISQTGILSIRWGLTRGICSHTQAGVSGCITEAEG
jgi:prepilin-type N-terminal cleavage/methylation domain-containing protein